MKNNLIDMNHKTLTSKISGLKEHYHAGYEMIFITEGKSEFTIEDKVFTYEKNSLLFLNDLEKHKMNPLDIPYSRYMVIVDSNYLDSIIKDNILLSIFKNRTNEDNNGFKIKEQHIEFITSTLEDLRGIFSNQSEFWEMEFMAELNILLVFLFRNYPEQFPINRIEKKEERILNVQSFIDANFKDDIHLDLLVDTFFISKYYLCHSFKEVTGFTINQYILLKRISYSKNLLYFTNKNVTEIALDCGFNSQSSFIRSFKQKEGRTPLQFRKYYRASD